MSLYRRGIRSTVAQLPTLGVTWLLGFFVDFHDSVKYAFILVNSLMVSTGKSPYKFELLMYLSLE